MPWPKLWYPNYDLALINTLLQTCQIISCLVQTDVKGILKGFCCCVIDNDENVASFQKHTQNGQNLYPIYDQQTAKKPYTGAALPI